MQEKLLLKRIELSHHAAVFAVMKSLPKWFNEDARKSILIDLNFQKGFVAEIDGEIVGFITYFVYEGVGHIGWLGVKEENQNGKIGGRLLESVEKELLAYDIHTIHVWTLSDTVDYEPYEKTRRFYFHKGFKEYRRIKTDNPGCPEELHLRKSI